MHPLHQLRIKLLNALEASNVGLVDSTIDEIFQALGGCELCLGSGYLASGKSLRYCNCERAERLKGFVKVIKND